VLGVTMAKKRRGGGEGINIEQLRFQKGKKEARNLARICMPKLEKRGLARSHCPAKRKKKGGEICASDRGSKPN